MSSIAVLCIDDRPHVLELRKAALAARNISGRDRFERIRSNKDVGRNVCRCSSTVVQTGGNGRGSSRLSDQATIPRPSDHPAFCLRRYAGTDVWWVDEYVMKSELPEGLVRAVERVMHSINTDEMGRPQLVTNRACSHKPAA